MQNTFLFTDELPPAATPAVALVRALRDAGHAALLAGGCVRDLLLGRLPEDYDVATDALPDEVCRLFKPTRKVGVQFGVVLVRKQRRWIEVATFRSDGTYLDGRRPSTITPTDARHDALRRDFTVNGMFLDPLRMEVLDFVGGRADLAAGLIRAIGEPAARFDEDYLRLLRAVRFAARLGFAIEPVTLAAIRSHAPTLARVAPERVCDELRRMLSQPSRLRAWRLLAECSLLPYLWPGAAWNADQIARADTLLGRLPPEAPFTLALAVLVADRTTDEIEQNSRALTLSNDERETVLWLVAHQADLDEPNAPSLATLKRLMAHPAFERLRTLAAARHADRPDAATPRAALDRRLAAIPADRVQPPPLVTGEDLLASGLPPGPLFKELLDALYTRQLDEQLATRADALAELERLLRAREEGRL